MSAVGAKSVVWVVDDSPLDAERARRILASEYDVEVFHDGASALERLASGAPPDVLLLDWMMPGVSGVDVCRFVRSRERHGPHIAVLFVTAKHEKEELAAGLAAGAEDFISKPYDELELAARLHALVRNKRLVDRLAETEATLRVLLASSPDPLLILDKDGRVIFASEEVERLFGRKRHAIIDSDVQVLLPTLRLDGGERNGVQTLSDISLAGRTFSPSVRVSRELGEPRTLLSLRDVTQARREEQRRRDVYSILAHDLKTPLTAMMLRVEHLLRGGRGAVPPAMNVDLERIRGSIRGLIELINDFLDLTRLEATGLQGEPEAVEVCAVVERIFEDFVPLFQASELRWGVTRPAEDVTVLGEPRRLGQLVSNLVANGIKFTPPGGEVRATVESTESHVRVVVQDTGPGIEPEALSRIFDRYARTLDAEHRVAGSGLGLMIVRQIAEAHGGTVGVESEPGRGSSFWLELPRFMARAASSSSMDKGKGDSAPSAPDRDSP